jgi:hypothetical protein
MFNNMAQDYPRYYVDMFIVFIIVNPKLISNKNLVVLSRCGNKMQNPKNSKNINR